MLFNSFHFLLFFIGITTAYFTLNLRGRQLLLLLASCYFYMVFKPIYIFILLLTIVIDYYAGIYIDKAQTHRRKIYLVISLISNIGILAFFKYFNFFAENINGLNHYLGIRKSLPLIDMVLPIGLSFHTFQAMSYTIEVYRGNFKPERNFMVYSLYVMFYPQLVAGPIERPQNVLPQLNTFHKYSWDNLKSGLLQITWGLFKKVVIADRLALFVDQIYANPSQMSVLAIFTGVFFYSFQIYCDFSGYSDIALGTAKVMGYDLMKNFNQPYLSKSIAEFWRRWHISLSTWFRDYLYISLGGNRYGIKRQSLALIFVFLVSGLWHGASWAFILWGLFHGIFIVFGNIKNLYFPKKLPEVRWKNYLDIVVTFIIVTLIWIPFRAGTLAKTKEVIVAIIKMNFEGKWPNVFNKTELIFCFFVISILLIAEYFQSYIFNKKNIAFFVMTTFLLVTSYFFGVFNKHQFIYFQF